MRRFIVLLLPPVLVSLGSGCRSTCGERPHLLGRNHEEPQGQLAKSTGQAPCDSCSTAGNYVPSTGMNYPSYPSGNPTPFPQGAGQPSNVLPYPMIPAPGVPEYPAQPSPAIPSTTGRTASDPKLLK